MVHHVVNHNKFLDKSIHALSDATRRQVIGQLLRGSAPVKELARPFDMGLPAFLKHLYVLEQSGLIVTTKNGRARTCRIEMKRLSEIEAWLTKQRAM
ncbi:MAG: winged helix-turn-helix transcriptional regulator [Alphaproteobacteria bacterium]|nr:winged helix-turn-helix transcriptional regulator [Alphaproteobacteria bacterium]